jgi:acyl carrier protein
MDTVEDVIKAAISNVLGIPASEIPESESLRVLGADEIDVEEIAMILEDSYDALLDLAFDWCTPSSTVESIAAEIKERAEHGYQ